MSLFNHTMNKKQMQQVLDQEQVPHAMALAEEYMREQQPQEDRPLFGQPANKEVQVNFAHGCMQP